MQNNSETPENNKIPALEYLFHPKTIAIAGVSSDTQGGGMGQSYITRFREVGFKGNIYPLNPSGGEVSGVKIHKSILDVPEDVDFVISAIPARHTPQLMADCAAKGVKLVHFFSAGFSELGNETGKKLESEIAAIAREAGIRITGPNGMGIYSPATGLSFDAGFTSQSGPVGFIAQSGRNSTFVIRDATTRGVYFSKVISYGNGVDLNESDFIEYFRDDPNTKIIAAYIEGVKDGRRFFRVLREAARVKPVIIMKAGITEAGSRAAQSHTASIAGSEVIWRAAVKQAGAIQVSSMEELVDMLLLFNFLDKPKGNNISILGFSGAAGIQATDSCVSAGLNVPLAPPEIQTELKEICAGDAGSIFKNPFDLWPKPGSRGVVAAIELITHWDKTDLLLVHMQFDINASVRPRVAKPYLDTLKKLGKDTRGKTIVVLDFIITPEAKKLSHEVQTEFAEAGFPVFPTTSRAATALGKFVKYYKDRETL
ncbi:acetate--CoA ligase family protein [Chloroflexota bacterium]